jgi:tRNA-dihydrouridine synthase
MWRYTKNLQSLYETPALPSEANPDRQQAAEVIDQARRSGRTVLTELESKQVLSAYNIPTVETRFAETATEAVKAAEAIGYPVVLKLHSETEWLGERKGVLEMRRMYGGYFKGFPGASTLRHRIMEEDALSGVLEVLLNFGEDEARQKVARSFSRARAASLPPSLAAQPQPATPTP